MADVATLLAGMHVLINSINTRYSKSGNDMVYLTITVKSTEFLELVISKLRGISGVLSVNRSGNI